LRAFLAQSDVVVNCLPGVKSTERFVGRGELSAMKDTAILVNVGRGSASLFRAVSMLTRLATVDTDALVEALSANSPTTGKPGTFQIGGASVDVTDPEVRDSSTS
jgi:phosphoglycerate dehydrogenase-like enzyme